MLFDPDSSRFFVLNRTMTYIWRQCDGDRPLSEVAEGLAREFEGVDAGGATEDLSRSIEEMVSLGLLEAPTPAG